MNLAALQRAAVRMLLTLMTVSLISFLLVALLPGDLALLILADSATPERVAALRAELGLDLPLWQRYLAWLGQVLQGDLGHSVHTGESTMDILLSRLPVTLELIVLTTLVALMVAIPLGVLSAHQRDRPLDHATLAQMVCLTLLSVPPFVLGLLLIYALALQWHWLPATGHVPLSEGWWPHLQSFVMPVLALAAVEVPVYVRVLRSEMVTTLQQNHMALARAMGLPTWRRLFENALRPSLLSLITLVSVNMGRLLGGAIILETLFALPGIGQLLVESVYQQDHLVTQGIVLMAALGLVVLNLLADLVYALADPRMQRDEPAPRA